MNLASLLWAALELVLSLSDIPIQLRSKIQAASIESVKEYHKKEVLTKRGERWGDGGMRGGGEWATGRCGTRGRGAAEPRHEEPKISKLRKLEIGNQKLEPRTPKPFFRHKKGGIDQKIYARHQD